MMIDMIIKTKETQPPHMQNKTKLEGGGKSFHEIFNASKKDTIESKDARIESKRTLATEARGRLESKENVVVEAQKEAKAEDEIVGIEELIQQLQLVVTQLAEELITLEEAVKEIEVLVAEFPELLGSMDGELKGEFISLGDLFNAADLELNKEVLLAKLAVINHTITAAQEKTTNEVTTEVEVLPLEETQGMLFIEDATKINQGKAIVSELPVDQPYIGISEDIIVTEINLNQEVKKLAQQKDNEVSEDMEIKVSSEVTLDTNPIPMVATKEVQQFVNPFEEEIQQLDPKQLIQEVASKVQVQVEKGKSEMRIQLMPENLGSVFINISMNKGAMTAKLYAENEKIKELIDANLSQLKIALGDKGINISKLEVAVGHNQQDFNGPKSQYQQRTGFKLKRIKQLNPINGANNMTYANEVSSINPYLVDTKFDGLA